MSKEMKNHPTVTTHPIMECIAAKLFGIDIVPTVEQRKMVRRACEEAAKMYDELQAENNRLNELLFAYDQTKTPVNPLVKKLSEEIDRLKTIIAYGYVLHKEDLLNKENLKPNYVEWLETCKKIAEKHPKNEERS